MADLIDRQAALDVLRGYFDGMLETDTVCPKDLYGLFEVIPSADPKSYRMGYQAGYKAAKRWISCSTTLPKEDGDYYVTTHNGQIARYVFTKGASEEYWMRCATAWQPLPTPYREGVRNG